MKNGQGFKPIKDATISRDGIICCARVTTTDKLEYVFGESNTYPLESGCVQFWFKLDNIENDTQLFYGASTTLPCSISAKIKGKFVYLDLVDRNGQKRNVLISDNQITEGWNFFALNFMNRDDGPGYDDVCEYVVSLNGSAKSFSQQNPRIDVDLGDNPLYCIGNCHNDTSAMSGYITALLVSPRRYWTNYQVLQYYRASKDYIIDNQFVDNYVKTVDFSQTTLYTVDKNIQDSWDICPLHSSVTSLKGTKPIEFDLRHVSATDKDRTFNFNQKIKRYAYVADGSVLRYRFGQNRIGTIMMRAYTDMKEDRQYLFEGVDDSDRTIGLYRDWDMYLGVDVNGTAQKTNLKFTSDKWHTVGLSFQFGVQSGSSTLNKIRVFLDDNTYEFNTSYIAYTNLKISVGRVTKGKSMSSNFGSISKNYPLYGQIEMIAANSAYNELSTLKTLASELSGITKTTQYDELGMLKQTQIHKAGGPILYNTYKYKSRADDSSNPSSELYKFISKRVKQEEIISSSGSATRNYTWDACGRVTSITDSAFGNHSYTYDYRGFLTKADGETYSYDKNGNLTKLGSTSLIYDSTVKDKLTEVNGSQVEYSTSDPLNPSGWNGMTFQYEANRLSKFTKDGNTYTYKYNERGQRIAKIGPSGTTVYSYVGDNLVSEKGPNGRLDFLYDEQNTLYGFIKDGTPYYYVRDCLQNILGIIDAGGNLKVKYTTNAWGKTVITSTMDALATQNPFRYKGYYFDTESGMYYCHTRYYVPDWGRWLTADAPAYLDFSNLSYTNLFAYCGNNPVMYIKGGVSLGSDGMVHLSVGEDESQSVRSAAEWLKVGVGAIPDSILGFKYLLAKGIHKEFVYSTRTLYMFPELGANWSRFKIAKHGYGDLVGASIKQIVAGNARAGLGALAKSFCRTAALTGFINFGFNLYENNWQIDGAMLLDTAIDTGIGLAAYGLAVGTVSLAVAGLAMLGLAVPGGIVVVAIIGLSIFFDWAIREITGYKS